MKKVISVLLVLTMLAGIIMAIPFGAGAVTTVSNGRVSSKVYKDIHFSEYLTEDMTSDQIKEKLSDLGLTVNTGTFTFSYRSGKLNLSADQASSLNLVKGEEALKTAESVMVDLGISVSQPENATEWAFYLINSEKNEQNCYKIQVSPTKNSAGNRFYKLDPGVKVNNAQLVTSGTTRIVKAQSNTGTDYPNSSVNFADTTAFSLNVDRNSGLSAYINGQEAITFYQAAAALEKWRSNLNTVLNSSNIRMYVNAETVVSLEYMRIYDRVPELTVTEVMYAGADAVEVYNSSLNPVNVYDYCLYVSTSGAVNSFWQGNSNHGAVGSKWGTETETIGYTIAGTYTYEYMVPSGKDGVNEDPETKVDGNDTAVTLTNPDYEEGVLQPGECAVLYIPANAIGMQTMTEPLSLESFKSTYGVTSKVFYCYSVRNLNLPSDASDKGDDNEARTRAMIGLGKVTFENGDHSKPTVSGTTMLRNQPAVPCIRAIDYGMFESWVVIGYGSGSCTVIGQSYPQTGNENNSSVEFISKGRFGNKLFASGTARNVNGNFLKHSLGSILDEQKVVFTSVLINVRGEKTQISAGIDEKVDLPVLEGTEWRDSAGNVVTAIRENTEDTYTQVTDLASVFCGAQVSKTQTDRKYEVRFVATINSLEYDRIGFEIEASYGEGEHQTFEKSCQYVYTSILGYGKKYDAVDFNGSYLMALHISGIPQDVGEVTYTVKTYTVMDGVKTYGLGGSVTLSASD